MNTDTICKCFCPILKNKILKEELHPAIQSLAIIVLYKVLKTHTYQTMKFSAVFLAPKGFTVLFVPASSSWIWELAVTS